MAMKIVLLLGIAALCGIAVSSAGKKRVLCTLWCQRQQPDKRAAYQGAAIASSSFESKRVKGTRQKWRKTPKMKIVDFWRKKKKAAERRLFLGRISRFSKHNATSKEDATARGIVWTRLPVHLLTSSGQGRVTFTTAFSVFSRRQHNAKAFIQF